MHPSSPVQSIPAPYSLGREHQSLPQLESPAASVQRRHLAVLHRVPERKKNQDHSEKSHCEVGCKHGAFADTAGIAEGIDACKPRAAHAFFVGGGIVIDDTEPISAPQIVYAVVHASPLVGHHHNSVLEEQGLIAIRERNSCQYYT